MPQKRRDWPLPPELHYEHVTRNARVGRRHRSVATSRRQRVSELTAQAALVEEYQRTPPREIRQLACRVIGSPRGVAMHDPCTDDQASLTRQIIKLKGYVRYGATRITRMLRNAVCNLNSERVSCFLRHSN